MKPYFAFQWHITDNCDQRCKHCYIFAEDNCKQLSEMPWEKMKQVVESCEDMCRKLGRTPYFYITGGDPILHRDFWKLAKLLKYNAVDCIDDEGLFHFHENPNADCPVGRNIHKVMDGRLSAAQQALENELKRTTIAEVIADTRNIIEEE